MEKEIAKNPFIGSGRGSTPEDHEHRETKGNPAESPPPKEADSDVESNT